MPIVTLVKNLILEVPNILSFENIDNVPNSSRYCLAKESVFPQENLVMITGKMVPTLHNDDRIQEDGIQDSEKMFEKLTTKG